MPKPLKKAKNNPTDPNLLARSVIEAVIGEPLSPQEQSPDQAKPVPSPISQYLAKIGRKGGLKGGKARASSLTSKQRKAIAKKAASSRWALKGN